jgi:hypothetical protein
VELQRRREHVPGFGDGLVHRNDAFQVNGQIADGQGREFREREFLFRLWVGGFGLVSHCVSFGAGPFRWPVAFLPGPPQRAAIPGENGRGETSTNSQNFRLATPNRSAARQSKRRVSAVIRLPAHSKHGMSKANPLRSESERKAFPAGKRIERFCRKGFALCKPLNPCAIAKPRTPLH